MPHALATALCAECGEPLAATGACIACLLRAGLDEADEAEAPDVSAAFGDFEIERREDGSLWELGRGAAGVTYRATDKVLHRTVALKVIEPVAASDASAMRERFLREARAAAALRHPNIATVFQFGRVGDGERCYCAMELVEGETLEAHVRRNGPITPDVAFDIGAQVAAALVAAAERGLVHRDLKPGNIMLASGERRPQGDGYSAGAESESCSRLPVASASAGELQVKVIDFGLAKAITSVEQMELTQGSFVGTPAFASPEQFAGDAVDARSDIYALGVTLWFALTGRLPSAGTTVEEIRRRQAAHKLPVEQLQARGIPDPLIALLRSCLEPVPANRPASARELLHALEESRAQVTRRRRTRQIVAFAAAAVVLIAAMMAFAAMRPKPPLPPSAGETQAGRPIEKGIAVLPFENLSADKQDAFFATAMQDDVLTSLAKIKDLKVIARSSVEGYREQPGIRKVRELGKSLGISHVLEGSVRRTGERLVLNVALIDTRDERQVWAERYDRPLSDTASLHGELAQEIGRALQATLTPLENAAANRRPTENAEAYLLYLKGREMEVQRSDAQKAAALYEQAVALDPAFALARARLSTTLTKVNHEQARIDEQGRARVEAEEALRLQPNLGEARVALAFWHLYQSRDFDRAAEELQRAAELLPNSAEVQLTAAFLYKLQNRFRDRVAALHRAEALDPRNPAVLAFLIHTSRWVRDWPEAMQAADRRAVFTKSPAHLVSPWSRANDEFRLTGDVNALKRALVQEEHAETPVAPERLHYARFEIASLGRDFARAARSLDEIPAEAFTDMPGRQRPLFVIATHGKEFHQALLAVASGRDAVDAEQALARARQVTEAAIAATRADPHLYADLALLYAFSGQKDEAMRSVQRAIEQGASWSEIERNDLNAALALVHARTGEPDKALDLIEHLLTVPAELESGTVYNMTLTDLKWRWVWDPLREHPRFQKLLAGPEPKTVY